MKTRIGLKELVNCTDIPQFTFKTTQPSVILKTGFTYYEKHKTHLKEFIRKNGKTGQYEQYNKNTKQFEPFTRYAEFKYTDDAGKERNYLEEIYQYDIVFDKATPIECYNSEEKRKGVFQLTETQLELYWSQNKTLQTLFEMLEKQGRSLKHAMFSPFKQGRTNSFMYVSEATSQKTITPATPNLSRPSATAKQMELDELESAIVEHIKNNPGAGFTEAEKIDLFLQNRITAQRANEILKAYSL